MPRRTLSRLASNPAAVAGLLLSLLAACGPGTGTAPDPTAEAVAALDSIADDVWERRIADSPRLRMWQGLPVEALPDLSYEKAEADAAYAGSVLERLVAIDPALLPHDDWITWAVLERDARMTVEAFDYYWYTNVLTPYSSAIAGLRQIFQSRPLGSAEERAAYLALLDQVPGYVREVEMLARGNQESGFVVSAQNMPAIVGIVRGSIVPAEQGMFAPGPRLAMLADPAANAVLGEADSSDGADVERPEGADLDGFRAEVERIVAERINPALESLSVFLETEYAPDAPEGVGLSQYPRGDELYRFLVRYHTTMEVTPREVHQIGLDMVARMKEEMAAIQAELGFEGTMAEFRDHLFADPQYFPRSPDEVKQRIEDAANAFFARRDEFFAVTPKAPFQARRLDPALESSQTYGYYNPPTGDDPAGYYNFNGSKLDERSWINLKGVAYHELFPGHHYQIMRVMENEALHPVRRTSMPTAYTEGWGSYSTYLGLEQGMIPDRISQYGVWMMEIFLANRLIIDTGMNGLGMTLDEGRATMRANTFESETQIATETLRYSTDMPGQALAYQMGKRGLLDIRDDAMERLGERFDLRAFHEAVLSPGALPLEILRQHIDWWVDQQLAAAG
jgi:uncharacterized protein (DUF885 family)